MKRAVVFAVLLVSITAIGSYFKVVAIPYIIVGAVAAVTILITLDKIKPTEYPIYIYALSLALIWQTTMLGIYVVGADIHGELSIVNKTIADGWDFKYYNPNSTSIIIGWLSPFLAKLGFDPIWQFKAFFPAILACVPVILFYAYKKILGDKCAFYSSLFFMLMPVFFLEIVGIVKSMVAEVFFALLVLITVTTMKAWKKAVGIGLCLVAVTFIHYTISMIIILLLFGALAVTIIGKIIRIGIFRNIKIHIRYVSAILVLGVLLTVLWYGNVGGGSLMYTYKMIIKAFGQNAITYGGYINPWSGNFVFHSESETATVGTPIVPSPYNGLDGDKLVAQPKMVQSPMDKQEPLVKMAVGLDFSAATFWGKIFRVIQYLTQGFILIGFAYAVFRYKRYNLPPEFMALVVSSLGMLAMCVFIPVFSSLVNMTRFYHYALFAVAPMLVIGFDGISSDLEKMWARKQR